MGRLIEAAVPRRLGTGFRWLLGGSSLANLGDGFVAAAGPLLVASQTRSPALVAAAAFLQRLPWLLFALHAGVLADRRGRRAIVIATDVARSALMAILVVAIALHRVNIAVVLAVLFVLGVIEVFNDTASQTLLPMLVEPDDLGLANARLYFALIPTNQLFGPPVGALLFASGMALPFLGEVVLTLAAATMVSRIRLPRKDFEPSDSRVGDEIRDGVRWLWSHPAVRTLALTIFTFNITYGADWSVLVLYTRERLGLGEVGFGLVTSAIAIGGLIGTSSYSWLERRFDLGWIMRVVLLTETAIHLLLAIVQQSLVALVIFVAFGIEAFVWGTVSTTVRQRAVPDEFQGRVASVYLAGVFGGLVVGAAIGGLLAQWWGITAPFWFAFAGSAVILALIWRSLAQIAHATSGPATS